VTGVSATFASTTPAPPARYKEREVLWSDLRERDLGDLDVGATVMKMGAGSAWFGGRPDGRIRGAMGWAAMGSLWTITARDGEQFTVVRDDGQVTQTFTRRPDQTVIAVEPEPKPEPRRQRKPRSPAAPPTGPRLVLARHCDGRDRTHCYAAEPSLGRRGIGLCLIPIDVAASLQRDAWVELTTRERAKAERHGCTVDALGTS
jgi:hypothetical protein